MWTLSLLPAGAQITVVGWVTNNPGPRQDTMAYFSYVKRFLSDTNGWIEASVIITRSGKTGKPRLDQGTLYLPTVYGSCNKYTKRFADNVLMGSGMSLIQRTDTDLINIYDLDAANFLGWAISKVMYLKVLCRRWMPRSMWPGPTALIAKLSGRICGSMDIDDIAQRFYYDMSTRKALIQEIRLFEVTIQKAAYEYWQNLRLGVTRFYQNHIIKWQKSDTIKEYTELQKLVLNSGGMSYVF